MTSHTIVLLGLLCLGSSGCFSLEICAFNIQTFGVAKMGKPHVVEVLVQIINRYDIVFIQEIRDINEIAIYELLEEVNSATDDPWELVLSERLGRSSSYKEQYSYFYRPSKVLLTETYQVPEDRDGDDIFERPPYVAKFTPNDAGLDDFGFIGIHVRPADAVEEIDALTDVYYNMVTRWGIQDFILGGDFNAGCSYVGSGDWDRIRLRTEDRFEWVIGDDANTNVAQGSRCPYDRFVLAGDKLKDAFTGADVFYFDEEYDLTNSVALEVSDHYPVEMGV